MCSHCPSSATCGSQGSSGVSGKQAPKNLTLWRRIVQFIFLFIMGKWVYYGIFRCPYIVPFVNCESCSMITCWAVLRHISMLGGLFCQLWSYSLAVHFVAGSVQVGGLTKCWEKYLWDH